VSSENVSENQTMGLDKSAERFEVRTTADSHFSWLRTRLSLERTMMSWLRTGVSLIGFGFAIVQFFERFAAMPGTRAATYPKAPEYLGLALIFCGVLALMVSIWQYRWTIQYMWGPQFRPLAGMRADVTKEKMQSPVIAIAVLLCAIGVFAFFAVLLRQV
jgi:putative membrane protein